MVNERSDIRRVIYENLRTIIDMSAAGEFNNCMFVFAGTNDLFENDEKGLKSYTALYKRVASNFGNSNHLRDLRQPVIKITGLGPQHLYELLNKVIDIHKNLHNWKPQISQDTIKEFANNACSRVGTQISEAIIRDFLKKAIEMLDIMEQNPGHNLFESEVEIFKENTSSLKSDTKATGFLDEFLEDNSLTDDDKFDEEISLT